MVYEIYYEPNGAVWRIRIITIYCGFISVSKTVCMKTLGEGATVEFSPMDFDTYEEAEAEVSRIGLARAYSLRHRGGGFVNMVHSVGAHATSA